MVSIGLRVGTSEINYTVFEGTFNRPKLVVNEKLRQPASYSVPEALSYYRNQMMSIIKEYKIVACGIRVAEPLSRFKGSSEGSIKRANIEGVMMETFASLGIELRIGTNATFAPLFDVKSIKDLIDSDEFKGIKQWVKLNKDFKEASIAGIASLKREA